MLKKTLSLSLALMLGVTPIINFADDNSLDQEYMDLIFGKVKSMTGTEKKAARIALETAFYSDLTLNTFKKNWEKSVTDEQMEKLPDYGLSEATVEENIEKLKSWDDADRQKLIDYALGGNESALEGLNDSYDQSSSGGSSSGGGGGGGSVQGGTEVAVTGVESIKSVKEKLLVKGLRAEAIQLVPDKANKKFEDVQSHWSKDYVEFFVHRGVISGRSEMDFAPDASITKGEILTLLTKVMITDSTKVDTSSVELSDVNTNDWYSEFVKQSVKLGIVDKDAEGKVYANKNPQRQEIIQIMMNALDVMELEANEASVVSLEKDYIDTTSINPSYRNAMERAVALGWIKGMGDGRLAPQDEVTRGQIAVLLKYFHDYVLTQIEEGTK